MHKKDSTVLTGQCVHTVLPPGILSVGTNSQRNGCINVNPLSIIWSVIIDEEQTIQVELTLFPTCALRNLSFVCIKK